jgi:hypothetical protein
MEPGEEILEPMAGRQGPRAVNEGSSTLIALSATQATVKVS